jgi:putative transposase
MKQRWTFRAYPTPKQAHQLTCTFGCVRYVWNWALHLRSEAYAARQERISYLETSRRLTTLKHDPDSAWLQEVSCVPLQQALRDLQTAFLNFFEQRAAYPQFKKKNRRQSAEFTRRGFSFDPTTKALSLAKIGVLKIRWSRDVIPMPSSVRMVKTTTGKYFVSLVVETAPIHWPKSGETVGLDFGVTHLATLSTGETIDNPRYAERQQRRLALLQRRLARKQKGSRRREAAKHRVAIIHERIRQARQDALHKLTTALVKRFDVIYLEDLNLRGMGQNHSLARVLSDAAIGTTRRLLEAKAARYGKTIVTIDRFFPSSKTCSTCGHCVDELPLSIRSWACPVCRTIHDRDVNAAKNILAAGQAVAAHGAGRRPQRILRRGTRRRSANHPNRLAMV